ncbi:hypothetical protein EIN_085950 [Entamoeba invadens IP1]|uniref:hypothetical protein n=1 Tax=Entamoeba invadens IP1 TaxID=370355 RepID=UPI0002C3F1F8|nr:hypothetical protein EIN_085950 [Entamoeba invadens IP1]ELP85343.1 hypothetical protein EIN_085950 [Entamoeba invadens IP1]|eukprot:XP_004184689.1 hypothetical protein EIN_085950 [Entamoeba invadens IP1]
MLQKNPTECATSREYTTLSQKAAGKMEDKNWKISEVLSTRQDKVFSVGCSLMNTFECEALMKFLYNNANPITAVLFYINLNYYNSTTGKLPSFINERGYIIKEIVGATTKDKTVVSDEKKWNNDKQKPTFCDKKIQYDIESICEAFCRTPSDKYETVKNDFDCLLSFTVIDSIQSFPLTSHKIDVLDQSEKSNEVVLKILHAVVKYLTTHFQCDCEKPRFLLRRVLMGLFMRPHMLNFLTPEEIRDLISIITKPCKCTQIKTVIDKNYFTFSPTISVIKTVVLSSILPFNKTLQIALLENVENEKNQTVLTFKTKFLTYFPPQDFETCVKLMNLVQTKGVMSLLYSSLKNSKTLPDNTEMMNKIKGLNKLKILYFVKGVLPYPEKISSGDLEQILSVVKDFLMLRHEIKLPPIPDTLDLGVLELYVDILFFVSDKANKSKPSVKSLKKHGLPLVPLSHVISALFRHTSVTYPDTLLGKVAIIYIREFYEKKDIENKKGALVLITLLATAVPRTNFAVMTSLFHEEFITLCLRRVLPDSSYQLRKACLTWNRITHMVVKNKYYQSFVSSMKTPLSEDDFFLMSILLHSQKKKVFVFLANAVSSFPRVSKQFEKTSFADYRIQEQENESEEALYGRFRGACQFMSSVYFLEFPQRTNLPILLAERIPDNTSCALAFNQMLSFCPKDDLIIDAIEAVLMALLKDFEEDVASIIKAAGYSLVSRASHRQIACVLSKVTRSQAELLKALALENESNRGNKN